MKEDQKIAIACSPPHPQFETLSFSEVHPEGQEILKSAFHCLQHRNVLSESKGQFSFSIFVVQTKCKCNEVKTARGDLLPKIWLVILNKYVKFSLYQ